MRRKGLSKSVRFEVFKRDKFTCQYCGGKAPDIVLHIDHIEPVSKGGDNDIINLITSCFECNLGKSNRKLNDNSVVEKQRKQLEQIQERREQMELMFKWKKSLSNLDDEIVNMVKEYVEAKIQPFTISICGKNDIRNYLRKYDANEILDAVDVSATAYLKFSNEDGLSKDSVEKFIDKIGGILFNRKLSPIEQKVMYIKNNAKKNLGYFDIRRASIILREYVATLRKYWNYSDDEIMKDLDSELAPRLGQAYNWTEWTSLIEDWITSIKKKTEDDSSKSQNNRQLADESPKEWSENQFKGILHGTLNEFEDSVNTLVYLLTPFPKFQKQNFIRILYEYSIKFLGVTANFSEEEVKQYEDDDEYRENFIRGYVEDILLPFTDYEEEIMEVDGGTLMKLEGIAFQLIQDNFEQCYFHRRRASEKDRILFRYGVLEHLQEKLKTHNQDCDSILE